MYGSIYKQIAIKKDIDVGIEKQKVFECSHGVQMKCIHSSEQVNNTKKESSSELYLMTRSNVKITSIALHQRAFSI